MIKELAIYKAQEFLEPECTHVHEDFKNSQQRSKSVILRLTTDYRALSHGVQDDMMKRSDHIKIDRT